MFRNLTPKFIAAASMGWLTTIPVPANQPVGIFGSGSGANDAAHIGQHVLQDPTDDTRHYAFENAGAWIDPTNFSNYSMVVACRLAGEGSRPWTREELPIIEDYLREGGILVLMGTAVNTLGRGRNLNRIQHLLGAGYFSDGSSGEILAPDHFLMEGVELDHFNWRAGGSLTDLQGAVALVGEPEKASLTWTPIGKGGILFVGQEFFRVRSRSQEESAALTRVLHNVLDKAGAKTLEIGNDERGWGLTPLGESATVREKHDPPVRRELVGHRRFDKLDGPPLILARDGHATCTIAIPVGASPGELHAAELLQEHLEQIIGDRPEVTYENLLDQQPESERPPGPPVALQTVLFVGNTHAARQAGLETNSLPEEGYLIEARDGEVFLSGKDRNARGKSVDATVHAVVGFLENTLGVRWLWPGPSGTVIPRAPELEIAPFRESDAPAVAHRTLRYSSGSPGRERSGLQRLGLGEEAYHEAYRSPWLTYARLGSSLNLSYGHAFGGWWDRFGTDHPEWFALQPDGSRTQVPARERLCKSNPELAERAALEINRRLTEDPSIDAASVSPNDGSGSNFFCMCEECRSLDPPEGDEVEILFAIDGVRHRIPYPSLTDRVMTFYVRIAERVAEEHPDRLLGAYAYSRYRSPPLATPVPENLLIGFVGLTYFDEYRRTQDLRRWDGWAEQAQHIFFRPNLLLEGMGLPAVYTTRMADDVKHFYQTGLIGVDYSRIIHNWSTQGLNYYVLSKLLWDPSLDPEEIIEDYCRTGFGPAWKVIREYFKRIEQHTDEIAARVGQRRQAEIERELRDIEVDFDLNELPPPSRELATIELFTPDELDGLRQLLKEAADMTTDPEILERIAFLEIGLDYADLQIEIFRLSRMDDTPEVLSQAREILGRRHELFLDIMENNPFAVGVVWILWRENVRWERAFGWEPPTAKDEAEES